ncbi:hypothetical protein, partial [Bacillus mycoides]|uniref:hypothetical protein n=1 Tax=Bacillus mycoides TaxID=1405 RepID=UPI003A7F98A9
KLRERLKIQADIRAEDRSVKLDMRKGDSETYLLHEAAAVVGFGSSIFLKYVNLLIAEGRVYRATTSGYKIYTNEDVDVVLEMKRLKDAGWKLHNAAKKVLGKNIEYTGYTKTHPYKVKEVMATLDVGSSRIRHCIGLLEKTGYQLKRVGTHRVFSEKDVHVFREVFERNKKVGATLRGCVEDVASRYVS